jgi:hypothetical protein
VFAHNNFVVPVWPIEEFLAMVGRSRASAIRDLKILLCAEVWLQMRQQLHSPVREPTDVAETLRTFATRCTNLKRIAFDNDIGRLVWYHDEAAAETVEVMRNTFQKADALRHVIIQRVQQEDAEGAVELQD